LALLGLSGLWRCKDRAQWGVILLGGLALIAAIFMLLPASVSLWDRLPFLAFVQRPSRLLSLPTFLMAVLSGALLYNDRPTMNRRADSGVFALTVGAILVIIGGSLSLLYPRYIDVPSTNPTLLDMMAYEHASGTIGATSFGEYLPVWVRQPPGDSPLEPLYRSGGPLDRLDRSYLPAGAQVKSARFGPNRAELTVILPEAAQLVFHTFYFPGWRVTVNGQEVVPFPVSERGLLGMVVPAGESEVRLRFDETPVRLIADLLSALVAAITLVLALAILYQKWSGRKNSGAGARERLAPTTLAWGQMTALAGLALALILTKTLYLDRFSSPFKRQYNGPQDIPLQVRLDADFDSQFTLLGYDLPRSTVVAGGSLNLTLYWQARRQQAKNYSSLAQLIDDKGNVVSAQDNLHPGQYPTSLWQPWGYVTDPHSLPLPPDTPPGRYMLIVGLYEPDTWRRLPVMDSASKHWADVVPIGPVTIIPK
jgi:flagellar biogenesis protein FliO